MSRDLGWDVMEFGVSEKLYAKKTDGLRGNTTEIMSFPQTFFGIRRARVL